MTMSDTDTATDVVERLAAHRVLGRVPREELEWLAAHGTVVRHAPGDMIARKGEPVEAMYVLLTGHVSHITEQGGTLRKVMDFRAGDVTGQLPYSRLTAPAGNSVVQEPTEILRVERACLTEIPVACPHVAAELVHVMLDRARAFKASDLQGEKMASLGKLSAGLAHELNNPAAAAVRSAELLADALVESDDASRALGAADLDAGQRSVIDRVRAACLHAATPGVLSAIERADREDAVADWLADHDVDDELAAPLADTDVTLELLDALGAALDGDRLRAALRWLAAGCTVRGLARDVERAASRISSLVGSVKRFTRMDQAAAPEAVDVGQAIADTLAMLGTKARAKSAAVTVDVPADLPHALAFGGELNQVWMNLIDNALDAVRDGGRVTVTARAEGGRVVVCVRDDGPGIPPEVMGRIFDPFFTTKPVGKGTGLGLDTVRQLVNRNNGLVEVDSEPGRTEFRVSLPAAA
jgi:signal transduction histidine kinase